MTTTTPTIPAGAAVKPSPLGYGSHRLLLLAAVLLPPAGVVLILLAGHDAANQVEPGGRQFALFWAGFLVGMLPLVALACASQIDGATRTCALAGIGLFGIVPKLLRTASGPTASDEFCHLRQIMEAFLGGDVGHRNHLLPITEEFPGLHQAASAFARLTGLPVWPAGLTVVVLAHILSVLAVYQLVRMVGVPAQGAAAGAVIYTLNPSWMYFDTAVSYESLALPLLLWCLAATVAAGRASQKPDPRFIAAALLCVVAMPVIHHLTTVMLCLILGLLIVARIVIRVVHRFRRAAAGGSDAQRERLWPLMLIACCLVVSIAYWWSGRYTRIFSYLGPALVNGFAQLRQLFDGNPLSGKRMPFGKAVNPPYEIISGYLFPAVVLVLFLWSLAVLWRNRRRVGSAPWAFAVLGAMYFASMPMVLTNGGAEGAHRSWAFSFIGIAVLFGLAWSFRPRPGDATDNAMITRRRHAHAAATRSRWLARAFDRPSVRAGVVGIVFTVMAFGGAALGVNVSHRFPGSPHVGDDPRSVSKEGAAVTAWLVAHTPVDTPVLADRYVSQQVGSLGRMATLKPSAKFPIWELYTSAAPVRPQVLKQVLDAKIRYFVVDARMATTRPRMSSWFSPEEPGVGGKEVLPQVAINRFNCLPWLRAVYGAGPLTVYEVNADVLRRTAAGSCEGRAASV